MPASVRVVLVQQDFPVGDLAGNSERIEVAAALAVADHNADIVMFPELALCGYPPEDLLLRDGFIAACDTVLKQTAKRVGECHLVVGHPAELGRKRFNAVSHLYGGEVRATYHKQALPNYAVFDERRYFSSGQEPLVITVNNVKIGLLICEDVWIGESAQQAVDAGAECLLVANASPYHRFKHVERRSALSERSRDLGLSIAYLNLVGGQDELIFDGGSFLVNTTGPLIGPAASFTDLLLAVDYLPKRRSFAAVGAEWQRDGPKQGSLAEVYRGLVRGTADYLAKAGFSKVVLGLSGGIDSALTLAIAVAAIGADNVLAVMMPSRFTSEISLTGARQQAAAQGVTYSVLPIGELIKSFDSALTELFSGQPEDITEENLQARIRGNLLMAISNKQGRLLLATSNKSELAVGYSTIYGDMCGGFSPLKDCSKTLVFELARHANRHQEVIPRAVIERPPSAELKDDQLDSDTLPDYALLDDILERLLEQDSSVEEIVTAGFEAELVKRISGMVYRNEYKRRQGAPGPRITERAFGKDRRYPICSGWKG